MNDKFKQLVLQAKIGTADFDVGSYYVATPDRMQKLCELIVRDVVEQIITRERTDGEWYQYDIFKHYGVEE